MRRLIFIILWIMFITSIVGCSNNEAITIPKDIKAVYLMPKKGGEFTREELKEYPQVVVVNNSKDLEYVVETVDTAIGIWIDEKAINKADRAWIQKEPQNSYPVILVGFYDVMNPVPMSENFYNWNIDWDSGL